MCFYAHIEPYGRIERGLLPQKKVGELCMEREPVLLRREVPALDAPVRERVHDARHEG